MVQKRTSKVGEEIDKLKDKVRSKLYEMAQDVVRDQEFGVSVIDVQAKVIPSELDSDNVIIHTAVRLDSSDLDFEFNGSGGKLLPQGGYTVTVDLPFRYKINDGDNILDVVEQEYDRIQAELKGVVKAVACNPERSAEYLPPTGTIITRHLLVGFKGTYALESLGIDGEAISQFTVQHFFGENGKIQLSVSENRLKKIGGNPLFAINDLRLDGGATLQNHSERGVQFEVDIIQAGNEDAQLKEEADRRLFAQTVRFNAKGIPQGINFRVAEERKIALRTARVAKQLDTGAGAGYSFGAIGLFAGYDRSIQTVYEARHINANRKEADDNLATWILASETDDLQQCCELIGQLRGAAGSQGAVFHATSRNDDAADLSAQVGKTFGTSHICLQMVVKFGKSIQKCNTIKRSLQISPGGKAATFTYDALDGKKFITTLMGFDVGLRVPSSLKVKIGDYRDEIVHQIESSFSVGNWLENLDLKEKVDDTLYEIIKEYVEKIALSFDATQEHAQWGRVILKASGIGAGLRNDMVISKMMAGDFSDAVASGLNFTTNTISRESFKAEVEFDFAGLLSYAMQRSQDVIDEKKTWEFDGKKFQIREITGEAVKKVESLNTTNFQVRSYYVTLAGEDGKPIPGVPTQALTTVVYTAKENIVARDKEVDRLIGMADALKFDTFVPFVPVRATGLYADLCRIFRWIEPLGSGQLTIATATTTAGHIQVLTQTPDEAQKFGEDVAKAVLHLGASPTPQLAAQTYDLGDQPESERLEIANFINKYFWGFGLNSLASTGWNNRIDPDEIKNIRRSIQKRLDDRNSDKQFEVNRIKAILPEGGVNSLPDGFILTAGASAILEEALSKSEKETSAAHAIYERTYNREVEHEKFIRDMGQWAREIAEDPEVKTMRDRLLCGERPNDEEILALLGQFMGMAAENTQGSTVIFSDDKDLQSLVRWTILHAMAGEKNVLGMVNVQTELGSFAAGSSPDLSPAEIEKKWRHLQNSIAEEKQHLDHEAHGC